VMGVEYQLVLRVDKTETGQTEELTRVVVQSDSLPTIICAGNATLDALREAADETLPT